MARSLLNATMPPGRPTANSSVVNALASQHRSSGRCGGHSRAVSTTCTSSMSRRKTGPSSDEGLQPPHTIRQTWLPASRNPSNIKADDRATSQPSQNRNVTRGFLEVAVETSKAVTKILLGQQLPPDPAPDKMQRLPTASPYQLHQPADLRGSRQGSREPSRAIRNACNVRFFLQAATRWKPTSLQ